MRHGFDYNDPVVVQQQLNDVRQQVIALKDHPALLIWGIGNELNLRATNPECLECGQRYQPHDT